jgi:hypothetical protein
MTAFRARFGSLSAWVLSGCDLLDEQCRANGPARLRALVKPIHPLTRMSPFLLPAKPASWGSSQGRVALLADNAQPEKDTFEAPRPARRRTLQRWNSAREKPRS